MLPTPHMIVVMVLTVSVLMAAHVSEVIVWSLAYAIIDVAPAGADPLYFAFVNYTTLGYGDVVPTERWRLIGPITAMNGMLVFGWSTAVIFEVLRRTLIHGSAAAAQQNATGKNRLPLTCSIRRLRDSPEHPYRSIPAASRTRLPSDRARRARGQRPRRPIPWEPRRAQS